MVRRIISLLFALILIFSLTPAIYAYENIKAEGDSLHISDDIISRLGAHQEDQVVRIYGVNVLYEFSKCNDVEDVLKNCDLLSVCYAFKSSRGEYTYKIERGDEFDSIEKIYIDKDALQMLQSGEVTKFIAPDVVVYNVYYLDGYGNQTGTAIYYNTNKGDFVYYCCYAVGECLLTLDAFCAYSKAAWDGANGYSYDFDAWDLSVYDFRSEGFDLYAEYPVVEKDAQSDVDDVADPYDLKEDGKWIILSIGAFLLVAGIAASTIIWHRRKIKH